MLRIADLAPSDIDEFAGRFALEIHRVADHAPIDGSYWGEPEAGIVGNRVFVRGDTPVHSFLHEVCHIVCMTEDRRRDLHRDAGGDDAEESAVCYLQILAADHLPGASREQLMRDMDEWGYSFRLGSTEKWFESDASDAAEWLRDQGLTDAGGQLSFRLRAQ